MGRPDWRAMLAGMSSTEYADWHRFYSTHYFHDVLLDMHFSGLTYTVLSLFFSDPEMHPLDFSLLNRREADEEPEDDVLMQKAAGLAGGIPALSDLITSMVASGYDYRRDDDAGLWSSADLTYVITYEM
ncbi:phage tail assembly protein T [Escherichia coli]|uniref:phage tail assembly protein T n=1 Tax=Escherichia coli TaxID=562 RepID=UPI003D356879